MEYRYHLTNRSAVPSILPSGGLVRADLCFDKPCGDTGWGVAVYNRPLTDDEIAEYHLAMDYPAPSANSKPSPKGVIMHNRAQCLVCGDIIESTHIHDYVTCSCGNLSVDGGGVYLKRSVKDMSKYKDLSVVVFPELSEPEE